MQKNMAITGRPFMRLANPKLQDLDGLIWEPWQDLALVLCIKAEGDDGTFWANIPAGAAGIEKIGREQAIANSMETLAEQAEIKDYADMLRELGNLEGPEIDFYESLNEELLVVTVSGGMFGAGAIVLPEIQTELRKRLGDFYIIPASRHEMLCFSAKGRKPDGLSEMTMAVNVTEVDPKDWLGDHAYICRDGVISPVGRECTA